MTYTVGIRQGGDPSVLTSRTREEAVRAHRCPWRARRAAERAGRRPAHGGGRRRPQPAHGLPVPADALFLPGSIGKLYTATLVMMLVDEGKLDLDTPIRHYLPDFEVRDAHARDTVTARHLLTHTSGFDGDHFTDTGRGDDALARYVAGCADLPQIVDPGRIWSYSNSGYADPRPDRRGAHRPHVRRGAARAVVHPARTRLDRLVRRRGDRAPRCGRPRAGSRGPVATGRQPGLGAAPRVRADGQRRRRERG